MTQLQIGHLCVFPFYLKLKNRIIIPGNLIPRCYIGADFPSSSYLYKWGKRKNYVFKQNAFKIAFLAKIIDSFVIPFVVGFFFIFRKPLVSVDLDKWH